MQRFLLGTNWKMHKNLSEALDYTAKLRILAEAYPEYQYFIIPPALYLQELGKRMAGSLVLLGAQNMHWLDEAILRGSFPQRGLQIAVHRLQSLDIRNGVNFTMKTTTI